MRRILLSLLLVSCAATADDMTDANKYLMAKEYGKALPHYTRLANTGNAEAQFRLGEMVWFGDGTRQDLQAARRWFEKSAAAGNVDAKEALAALKRRKVRGAEIAYWMSGYDGADLRSGKLECKAPAIPAVSRTNADVAATRKAIEGWQACYNGFATNFNATAPLDKRIPADVLDMMTPQEAKAASAHVQSVYRQVLAQAERDADQVRNEQLAWEMATGRFVKDENLRVERENRELTRHIVDDQRRKMEQLSLRTLIPSRQTQQTPYNNQR